MTTPPTLPPGSYPTTPPAGGYVVPPVGYPPAGYPYAPAIPTAPDGQRLAEFVDRLLARIIDGLVIGAVSMVVILPIYIVGFVALFRSVAQAPIDPYTGQPRIDPATVFLPFLGLILAILVLSALITYVYTVEMMFRSGQTLGKRALKIKIVPLQPGATLTRGMAAKRFLVEFGGGAVLPGFSLLDGLWQLWDKPYRQCLHDKFAETAVIKLNP